MCYIVGMSNPSWLMAAFVLAIISLFFVVRRLRWFRDWVRDGNISFMRSWGFVVLVFFYAGLLFALAQYAYFAFLDHGYFMQMTHTMMSQPESEQLIKEYGMTETLNESLHEMQAMRPIDMALNMLTTNIMLGMLVGIPIAALMKRNTRPIS